MDTLKPVRSNDANFTGYLTILHRGKAVIDYLFHYVMQSFPVFLSWDVLQMALDPATGSLYFRAEDIHNTGVLIFDDQPEGLSY